MVHRRRHRVRHRVRPVAVVDDDVGVVGAGVAGVFLRQSLGLQTPAGRRGPRQRHGEIRSAHRQADAVGVGRFDPERRALARDRALEAVARSLEHRRRRRARGGHRLQTPIRTTRHRGTPEQDVELVLRPGARGRPLRRVRPVAVIRHRNVRVSGARGRVHDVRSKRIPAGDGVVSVCIPRANGDPTGAVHDGAAHPGAVHEALRRVRRPRRHRARERRVGHVLPAHRHPNGRHSGNRRRVRDVVPLLRRVPDERRRLDDVDGAARPERTPGFRHRHVHGGGDRRVLRHSRVAVSIGGDDVKQSRRPRGCRLQPGADDARGVRVRVSGGDDELGVRGTRSADAFAAEVHGDDVRLRGGDVEADDVLELRRLPRDSNRAAGARRGRVVGAGERTRRLRGGYHLDHEVVRSILLDVVIVGVPEGDVDGAVLARGEGGGGDGDLGVVQFRIAGYDGDFECAHGVEHVAVRSRLRHAHIVDARLGELVRARVRAVVGGGVVSHGFLALLRVVVGISRHVELVRARVLRDDVAVRVKRDHREAHVGVGDDSTVLNRAAAEQQRLFRGRFRHRDVGVVNAHVNRREINRVGAARRRVAGAV